MVTERSRSVALLSGNEDFYLYCPGDPLGASLHCQHYRIIEPSKLKKWEFEREYRTQLFSPYPMIESVRTIQIPPNAFKEIILGALPE